MASGTASSQAAADAVRAFAQELHGGDRDYDSLLAAIGDSTKYVLIGEASHGTEDFYRERAEITKRLIVEKGFAAVALEADFPDTATVNAYVKGGLGRGADSIQALAEFNRFPGWMWRNTVMLEFLGWLRDFNATRPAEKKVGVYGLDLYSLYRSISEVLAYLRKVDPAAAERAAHFYACFRGYRDDAQRYGEATAFGMTPACEAEAVRVLKELQIKRAEHIEAEKRAMIGGGAGAAATGKGGGDGAAAAGVSSGGGHGGGSGGGSRMAAETAPASRLADIGSGVDVTAMMVQRGKEAAAAAAGGHDRRHHETGESAGAGGAAWERVDPQYHEFHAQVNALVARDAERYYRCMFTGRVSSWNLRDTHMFRTLEALQTFLTRRRLTASEAGAASAAAAATSSASAAAGAAPAAGAGMAELDAALQAKQERALADRPTTAATAPLAPPGIEAKVVIWAHNSHLGNAKATEVYDKGEINIGSLIKDAYPPPQSFSIGFTTHTGTVTAAHEWDGPAERKNVRPSLAGSYEDIFHRVGLSRFLLLLNQDNAATRALASERRLHRAIGVIYRPKTERWSHYFESTLPRQYDAVIHIDTTRALEPLERTARWTGGEEETYPLGL